jgi:hypothetical protein
MNTTRTAGLLLALVALAGLAGRLPAQEFWGAGRTFTTVRRVQLPAGTVPPILVVEFLAHGELAPGGANLAVYDSGDRLVPWHILQAGPGDFCRLAIQTRPKGTAYRIFYGGKAPPEKSPPWTAAAGLLLETRQWKRCDLTSLDSVRAAFESSVPLGGDYVDGVFHRFNPCHPDPEPFLSRYEGVLHAGKAGTYAFFTSSQDCSFLFLDGKLIVSAPGHHGPVGDARIRGQVELSAGRHRFEYLHAAAGPDACMVAAWQPPGAAAPEIIPARAFDDGDIDRVAPGPPRHARHGLLPDFTAEAVGDAGLAEGNLPLVRVRFLAGKGRHWDFGDGQSADEAEPVHVYLHPGLFAVKAASAGGPAVVNRIQVHRAVTAADAKKGPDRLADYLPILNRYDPTKLPDLDALQLVRFCAEVNQHDRAVKVGRTRLLAEPPPEDEAVVLALVRLVGPRLRDSFDDPGSAAAVWEAAARSVKQPAARAGCELEAADIRLHDLLQRGPAGKLLEAATGRLARAPDPALTARLHRLWGDWSARGGDRDAARAAYARAVAAAGRRSIVESEARRGAFSRSVEAFLRDRELDRARDELRAWQDECPGDRVKGYLTLLWARYHIARGQWADVVVVANDLLAVNRDAPHADSLVFLAAECEERLGHPDRARAGYKSLVSDYPGSSLVPAARQKLAAPPAPTKDPKKPPAR